MLKFRNNVLGNGASETGVYSAEGSLIAVITHPCEGAKWFLHRMGNFNKEKFSTKKEAIKRISEENA